MTGVGDRLDDLLRVAVGGVDPEHGEPGVGGRDPVRDLLAESVPAGGGLGPSCEPPLPFVLGARQVVRDGLRQSGRKGDAQTGSQRVMVRQAASEVALDDDGRTGSQVTPDLLGGGEERREIEAQTGLDVAPKVHLAAQGLVQDRHGGDQNGPSDGRQQRCHGGLPTPAQTFEGLERRVFRHGRTQHPVRTR